MERSKGGNFKTALLREMREGRFADCSRLPRETELAELLGISRTQLRDVLSELEREGYISRRHGVGTVINRHVLQVKNRMDIETEFQDIIRSCGHSPRMISAEVWEEEADARIAQKLGIAEGSPIFCKQSVCAADGVPAICWTDIVARELVKKDCTVEDFKVLIFDFLREYCGTLAYMDLTDLHAVAADARLSAALNVPEGTPLLNMVEVNYNVEGDPVFYSDQYFVDGLISHTVLRKKL